MSGQSARVCVSVCVYVCGCVCVCVSVCVGICVGMWVHVFVRLWVLVYFSDGTPLISDNSLQPYNVYKLLVIGYDPDGDLDSEATFDLSSAEINGFSKSSVTGEKIANVGATYNAKWKYESYPNVFFNVIHINKVI